MAVRPIDANELLKKFAYSPADTEDEQVFNAAARKIIQEMPTLTPPNEWVSVEERMPESRADVLVVAFWHENWQTMIGWYSDMEKKWRVITPHGEREPGGVTHWMPLPAPPDRRPTEGEA